MAYSDVMPVQALSSTGSVPVRLRSDNDTGPMHVQLAPLGSKHACADASSSASAVALAGTIAVVIMQPTARHRYDAFPADRAFAARESKDLVQTYIRKCTTSSTGGACRIGGGSHRPSAPTHANATCMLRRTHARPPNAILPSSSFARLTPAPGHPRLAHL